MGGNLTGITIVRTVGYISIDRPTGAIDVAAGLIVAEDTVDTADVNPVSDPFLDWMWFRQFITGAGGANPVPDSLLHYEMDLRSKRKLSEPGDQYFLVTSSNTGAVTFRIHLRTLVLLP